MVVSSFALVLALSLSQVPAQETPRIPDDARWKSVFAPCPGPLIVDLPEVVEVELGVLPKTVSRRALGLWAASLRREVIIQDRAIVLARSNSGMLDIPRDGTRRTLTWIQALTGEQSERLMGGGVWASDLPTDAQTSLARGFYGMKGLLEDLVSGEPIRCRLEPILRVLVPGRPGEKDRELGIYPGADFGDPASAAKERPGLGPEEPLNVKASEDGLDFGDGAVHKVKDLVVKIQKEFGRRYDYDNRLAEAKLFVKGRFSRVAMETALDKVLRVLPFAERTVDAKHEVQEQIDRLLGDLARRETDKAKAKLYESLIKSPGRAMTAGQLRELFPEFGKGVASDTRVTVSLELGLRSQGIGSWDLPDRFVDGRLVKSSMAKNARITLRP